ncbi:polyketide synthase [Fusarium beomiforme]|uniref:Polyketide synthase n=1 Tax=Fusarium beomiforme TaxID=44412 RepID=A0A9P5AAP4_9HYPO|nr:polyketide synthase [Fusarium beomiforme]
MAQDDEYLALPDGHVLVEDECIAQGSLPATEFDPQEIKLWKIPDWPSFKDAAAILTSFVTALYALTTAARVSTGQNIPVINATLSQGIVLIKMATALKLDVYATISDRNKSLLTKHGICSSNIFVIPTSASHSNVSRATNYQAYKLVLNTRSGQYAEFSHLVASRGTYIEIGLGETHGDEFYLRPNKNVMFTSIDLSDAYHESNQDLGEVEVCDVGDFAAVERLVAAVETPVGGVIHSALRLSDRFFEDITLEDFDVVFGPKINGSLNLHTCLLNHELDFFVMLSSGCGALGNEGQSNYSASSTFLDTFARYRQSLGLPACSVDLGYVEDVGNINERPGAIATGSPKNPNITKDSSYDDLSQSQIVLSFGMIDKPTAEWQSWAKDAKFGLLLSRAADNAAVDPDPDSGESSVQTAVKAFRNTLGRLADVPEGKEAALQPVVCSSLVTKLAQVLSMKVGEIQPTRSAVQYGMDSLIAIEYPGSGS